MITREKASRLPSLESYYQLEEIQKPHQNFLVGFFFGGVLILSGYIYCYIPHGITPDTKPPHSTP